MIKIYDVKMFPILEEKELNELVPYLYSMMTSFNKKHDKLLKELNNCHYSSPDRVNILNNINDLERIFKIKISKLGGRLLSKYRIRFLGEDAFYTYDFNKNELEKYINDK